MRLVSDKQPGAREVADDFLAIASPLLLWSMFPLVSVICSDFYLIARLIILP
jgi:hypothetical protein